MLTENHFAILNAVADRLIPGDDYPSGWEGGCGGYFRELFVREPQFVSAYETGLDALDLEAQATLKKAFVQLDAGEQDAILTSIEHGIVNATWVSSPREFFNLLVEQTMEGYYADPGNGGNKNGVAWEMINYRMTA